LLDAARITERLTTRRLGRSLDVRAETGSTNDDARAAEGAPDGHVVVADAQTAGRGSHGRTWASPPGTDLYFSIVLREGLLAARLPPLTLAVGLGVARACEAVTGARFTIKWPNDVRHGERKCAGILVESVSAGARVERVVIGIGLDVNREDFGELAGVATSLRRVTGAALDRETVLAEALGCVEEEIDRFLRVGPAAIVPRVEARLAWRGEAVECDGMRGTLEGLHDDGALIVGGRAVVAGTLRRAPVLR